MQAVPSLVGTGTVVAAAATGLVFGQPIESTPPRPASPFMRLLMPELDGHRATSPLSRPGTSPGLSPFHTVRGHASPISQNPPHPSPLASNPTNFTRPPPTAGTQTTPPKAGTGSRRHSFIRHGDWASTPIAEESRDSFSSHGSWIRRLSIRPLSQHGSPRSSAGPDSHPLTSSHGSGAPILSPTGITAPQLPPNKLVKRSPSGWGADHEGILSRRGSRSQVPTLRRPATSHQRSATLQQLPCSPMTAGPPDKIPVAEHHFRPRSSTAGQRPSGWRMDEHSGWASFFHSQRVKTTNRGTIGRSNVEGSPFAHQGHGTRIHLRRGSMPRAYLVSPRMLSSDISPVSEIPSSVESASPADDSFNKSQRSSPKNARNSKESPDITPTKKPRRSLSTHFGSPSGWIARAGSLRRPKRDSDIQNGGVRHVSAPVPAAAHGPAQPGDLKSKLEDLFKPPEQGQRGVDMENSHEHTSRNSSSPIPPLSRLSSFHVDLSKLGGSSSPPPSAGLHAHSLAQIDRPRPASQGMSTITHSRAVSNERASTLTSSDQEVPGLASGDDDDTDYKSDAVFDSFRTTASSIHPRDIETPLESMFDDSPPNTAGVGKTKRLSIQEILGQSWDGDTRIMEEDEGSATPIRGMQASHMNNHMTNEGHALDVSSFTPARLPSRDFGGRLSLDTEDDEGWALDDEDALSNPLSPPSSSVNSRRGVSPQLRSALANISGNASPDSRTPDSSTERPRSNIFDWSEPSHEKDVAQPIRPKTVHGKQELDLRAGRPTIRKSLTSGHVRSQSVPVVPDPSESTKAAPKFGTWGMGTKTASEDWDDDFEFEEGSNAGAGARNPAKTFSMYVPPSIQATQPTVKAHSGQIRELSLLVSSLKRLCRQGRDLNLIDGQSTSLWKEAENIIALASPDDEELDDTDADGTSSSSDFDPSSIDDRFLEEGFDASMLERTEDALQTQEPNIPKTAVVRERQVQRRRSVFSPDDDIFGNNWPLEKENTRPQTPRTPDRVREFHTPDGAVVSSVIEAMEQDRAKPNRVQDSPLKPSKAKLFFDTNSLQELVKRASTVFHNLSDIVRKEELLLQSPAVTPKHERHNSNKRHDGSPAFTRVFTDPASSPPRRTNSNLPRKSMDSHPSNGMGQRMQMMTVS